jgi:hypothetical protein
MLLILFDAVKRTLLTKQGIPFWKAFKKKNHFKKELLQKIFK